MSKVTISIPEAAKKLGVAANTVRKAIELGQVKSIRVGNNVRVFTESVEKLLSDNDEN